MAEKMYSVTNRSTSTVILRIPDSNIRRVFMPNETKEIRASELEKLSFQAGGRELMSEFLQIHSAEALKELDMKVEPEYNYTKQDIISLLMSDPYDKFLDALDFAPIGVIDMIKDLAVSIPMTDLQKREALKEKTGFDVTAALAHKKEDSENATTTTSAGPAKRRVATAKAE